MPSDIRTNASIFRNTPKSWHAYIQLARLDRPIGVWLLLLPGWWSITLASGGLTAMNAQGWACLVLFGLGALLMRSGGCVINDLWDRKLDAKVVRTKTRPLASGKIRPRQALAFLSVLLSFSLLILMLFNRLTVLFGFFALLPVTLYPLMKRLTWWPQLFLGFTFNWGALMGWTAVTGTLTAPAILIYCGGVFWTLAYDTIYAHQDKEDDALIGVRSTALKLGRWSRPFVATCFLGAIAMFAAAKLEAGFGPLTLFLLIPPALHALWQLRRWDMNDPGSCLKIFKSNRIFGWLILLLFAI